MQNRYLTGIIIAIIFLSCNTARNSSVITSPKDVGTRIESLDSIKFWLTKIHQSTGVTEVTSRKAFIRFSQASRSAGGNGGCNSFGSILDVDDNNISFSNIFSTKMYCEGVQSIEDNFFNQLQKVTRYELKGNTLLFFADEKIVLEFIRE